MNAEEATNEAARAIVPVIADIIRCDRSGKGIQAKHYTAIRARIQPILEKAMFDGSQ